MNPTIFYDRAYAESEQILSNVSRNFENCLEARNIKERNFHEMRDFNAHGPRLKRLSNHNIETMTTIDEVYCVPRTVEERAMFPHLLTEEHFGVYFDKDYGELCFDKDEVHHRNLTEIPVTHFFDLLHDRIVPWRLEEIGFQSPVLAKWKYELTLKHVWGEEPFKKPSLRRIRFDKGEMSLDNQPINISKFTDLLSLIRFLTPPPEET